MIYLLSDLHGDINFRGLYDYINVAKENDLLILLGDTGLAFEETEENKVFTDFFMSINKNVALIDGNHENFGFLNSFPEEEWCGGKVHRLTEHIVHLKRGNVFSIEGEKFFVFGGCKSSAKWKEMGRWFDGEEGSDEEYSLAYSNLKKHNFKVDYILTHKYEEGEGTISEPLKELTEFIEENVKYSKWYAGHWHTYQEVDDKHILIYDILTKLSKIEK